MERRVLKRIVIIGSGNVATCLAHGLASCGVAVEAVWSRNPNNAILLANRLMDTVAVSELKYLPTDCDLYLIAVSDDAISDIAGRLPAVSGIVAHTSGTVGIEVLSDIKCGGYGCFYPLQTFTTGRTVDLSIVPFFIEGNNADTANALITLAGSVSDKVLQANSDLRVKIHLSAVLACNFSNVLWGVADDILHTEGLTLEVLKPLLTETLNKAVDMSPDKAQTGPAKRNDRATINHHLEMIDNQLIKDIYMQLTNLIISRQCQK